MASVTMQVSSGLKSAFVGVGRTTLSKPARVAVSAGPSVVKVEAKGNWLPGSTSPAYLTGR